MTNVFQTVKESITTRQAAEFYGLKVKRNGMTCCPFHNDLNPSMKVDKNFYCFGCLEKGDVIRFTEKLFGLTPYDAAMRLIADFGLATDPHEKETDSDTRTASRPPPLPDSPGMEERFQKSVDRIYRAYCAYFHLLRKWRAEYEPRTREEEWHPLFMEALGNLDYVEYLLDILITGTTEEKAQIVIEKGKGLDAFERRTAEFESRDAERSGTVNG